MSRRRGNDYENAVCEMAEALGYCAFPARGSRGPVDVLAFDNEHCLRDSGIFKNKPLVPLAIQVGTQAKPIASTLAEINAAPRPIGSLCLVARRHRHKTSRRISWTWHSNAGKFATLAEALDART